MKSNRYIFIFSMLMAIIVAGVLASSSMLLKPKQEENIRLAKMTDILGATGVVAQTESIEGMYNDNIIAEYVVDSEGDIIAVYKNGSFESGDIRAFDIDVKKVFKLKQNTYPMYMSVNNSDTSYVIPVYGKGLWGPVWGNIALDTDFNTILGCTFDHKGETPGLGAEISTVEFQKQFIGKQIFDIEDKFISVKVVKGGVSNSNIDPLHGVDAITGGTITSDGVTDMLFDCLGLYQEAFKNIKSN